MVFLSATERSYFRMVQAEEVTEPLMYITEMAK